MEAIAALSLACNIIQVVDSTSKAVKACSQFYKYGATVDIEDLSYISDQLSQTSDALDKAQYVPPGTQLSKTDAALVELGKKVHDVAESLSKELNSFKSPPGSGRRATLIKTLKLKWRASRIEELKRNLEELVQVLDNKILVQLSGNLSVIRHNQGEILEAFDDSQREIAQKIIEGATTVEKLISSQGAQARAHVTQEHVVTRSRIDQIDKKIDQVLDIRLQKVEFDKFMQSLHFPEINLRQDKIEEAHEKTFEWIFERLEDTSERWHNFPGWLRSDQPLYWILGKPGSGKSTLMNFLVQDSRTLKELESSGQPTTILSFFFWEAGVELQKTRVGLLRSLIYQLLKAIDPNKALQVWGDVVQPHIPALSTIWTSNQLLPLLQMILQTVDQRFCFFLDGLDEFQDDVDGFEAIKALQDVLKDQNRIKMCIASRPQINLKELYQGCPKMVIQTLTEPDIRRYVEDKILKSSLTDQLGAAHSTQASVLVNEVVWKAEGVFLWVTLAVQSLLRGIRNEDHWGTLLGRLDQLPSGISDLYKHMWKRMADDYPIYAKEAALCLQIIQYFGSQSLLEMIVMVDDEIRANFSTPAGTWGIKQLEAKVNHERVGKRITACCAGFLEVTDDSEGRLQDDELKAVQKRLKHSTLELRPEVIEGLLEYFRAYKSTVVGFVHRTAAEYLNTSDGHALLQAQLYTKEELAVRFLRSHLIMLFLTPPVKALETSRLCWATVPWRLKSEEAATEFCSEAEVICRKLFAWGLWDLNDVGSGFIIGGRSDEVDYIKAFIDFSTPEYLIKKLNERGVAENRAYLTELLSLWAEGDMVHWCLKHVFQTGVLLLQLGADPNQVLSYGITDLGSCTTWTHVLIWPLLWPTEAPRELEKGSYVNLITVMLEAGADPNESHTNCVAWDAQNDRWMPSSEATMSGAFVLSNCTALDLVTVPGNVVADRIESLLRGAGAVSARKQVVCFQPAALWRVSTKHILNPPFSVRVWGGADQNKLIVSIGSRLDEFRSLDEDESRVFSDGLDALHAAGWTDEEMRKTPCLQRLWEELQQSGDEGQDVHEQHSTEADDIDNE